MNIKELRTKHGLSQQDLAVKTGIPRPRIAKWEEGKGSPKREDSQTLDKFFATLENIVSEEHTQVVEESGNVYENITSKTLFNISESNKSLAESNASLARSNEELVRMVKDRSTADAAPQSATVSAAILPPLLGLLFEIGTGKKYHSVEEMQAVWNNRIAESLGLKKETGIQKSSGKQHIGK
jgi:transcriptional regulator with XRE-family HTH domain